MKNYVTEFIGTFFLVLTIGLTVVAGTPFAGLAIGCALMVMVYMGGHISGGHYNPAVSLALVMRGKLPGGQFIPYVVSQILGAFAAAAVTAMVMPSALTVAPPTSTPVTHTLLIEALFTFALALVVLNTATHAAVKGNSFYGLAIGFTVVVGAYAGGPISGGAFNPAVGLGPALYHAVTGAPGALAASWLYIVGPCLGAVVAAFVFGMQEK